MGRLFDAVAALLDATTRRLEAVGFHILTRRLVPAAAARDA